MANQKLKYIEWLGDGWLKLTGDVKGVEPVAIGDIQTLERRVIFDPGGKFPFVENEIYSILKTYAKSEGLWDQANAYSFSRLDLRGSRNLYVGQLYKI